jgi:GrpB-like predicted nucleotidyltransferase (UPF0157 family)
MSESIVHFVPVAEIADRVSAAFETVSAELSVLLPDAEVEHIGATSIPGAITKGDLDVLVRVRPDRFDAAAGALSAGYEIHQPDNWSPTFASFAAEPRDGIPVGVQLAAAGSPDDRQFTFLRDLLRNRPDLLERMNTLKRSFDGGDPDAYWRAKQDLIESILTEHGLDEPPPAAA